MYSRSPPLPRSRSVSPLTRIPPDHHHSRYPHDVDHYHDDHENDDEDDDSGYDNDDDDDGDDDNDPHHSGKYDVHHSRNYDVHHGDNFDVHQGDNYDVHHGNNYDVHHGDNYDFHHGDVDNHEVHQGDNYDVDHGNYSNNRHRRHRNGHHKKRNSRSAFSMGLLRTAVTTLGDAVLNGREDGQRRLHNRQRPVDYNPQSLNPWGNKTADQVYETLVQAAYTLGEVVGDLEHKFGINPDEAKKSKNGRRKSKHRGAEDGYDREYPNEVDDGYSNYDDNLPRQQRPNHLRRQSSNPELRSSYHQYQNDDNDSYRSSRSSQSSRSSISDKKSKRHRRTGSPPPKSKEKDSGNSMKETILHQLPGLLTRAAFILELRELKQNNKDRKGMAGKYAMLLMAVKIIEQLGQEYVCYCEKSSKNR